MVVDVGEVRLADLHELRRADVPARGRVEGRRLRRSSCDPALPHGDLHRRQAAAAGHQEPAVQRLQVHRSRARSRSTSSRRRGGWNPENEELNRAASVLAFSVTRHRHRHPAGQAADHLRGVPAGRRQHQPQVRRHRPGPGDQPRDRPAAGRRDPPGQLARQGEHVHALPAAELRAAEDARARPAPAVGPAADRDSASAASARPGAPAPQRR